MAIKRGKIIIELQSDLCIGSGYSYAGVIDSDVCYDDCGIPYIPARRIKGCLRDTLEKTLYTIYENKTDDLFGSRGSDKTGDLYIGNAYIKEYEGIRNYLSSRRCEDGLAGIYDPQSVLSRFTRVLGQTKLEDGVAVDQSLRYTRIINQYSPIEFNKDSNKGCNEKLIFEAEVSCDDNNWNMLEDTVKCTRHIGLKRNRGLGFVRCSLEELEVTDDEKQECDRLQIVKASEGYSIIRYCVENIYPIMNSNRNEMVSEDYISGRSVLGALAAKYIEADGDPNGEEFASIFLSGKVLFSNLYPYKNGCLLYPAPGYINRLKKTGKYVNSLVEPNNAGDIEYSFADGNIPKKLRNTFVSTNGDIITKNEVKKEVVYHHSKANTNDGKEILYSLSVISPFQIFSGTITVPDEHLEIVRKLLLSGDFYFGKSKSSEYGRCRIIDIDDEGDQASESNYKNGDIVVITFLSDTVLIDAQNNSRIATTYEGIVNALRRELKLESADVLDVKSSIKTTLHSGYISKWNLQRESVPAISAGSYVSFKLTEDYGANCLHVGEFQSEGCGMIRFDNLNDMSFKLQEDDSEANVCSGSTVKGYDSNDIEKKVCGLIAPVVIDDWIDRKINERLDSTKKIDVTNTQVGRFTLMLKESMENADGYEDVLESFEKRVQSIKSSSTHEEGMKIIKEAKQFIQSVDRCTDHTEMNDNSDKCLLELCNLVGSDEANKMLKEKWTDYIMAILINRKYEGRVSK